MMSSFSLKHKLLALLLVSIALPLLVVGGALDLVITRYYHASAGEHFINTFARTRAWIEHRLSDQTVNAERLAGRADIIASVNLLHRYAALEDYSALVYDPEKQSLAGELQKVAKAASIGTLAVYGADGRLISFYTEEDHVGPGFVSYTRGHPVVRRFAGTQPGEMAGDTSLPELLALNQDFSVLQEAGQRFRRTTRGIATETMMPILRTHSEGRHELLGYVVAINRISQEDLATLSTDANIAMSLLFADGASIGAAVGIDSGMLRAAPPLTLNQPLPKYPLLKSDARLFLGYWLPLHPNERVWVVASMALSRLTDAIEKTRAIVLSIMFLSALIFLPLGIWLAKRFISQPVERLIQGVGAVAEGDYRAPITLAGDDEFAHLAGAINGMTAAIQSRELATLQSEAKYRTLVDNLPQRIFYKDAGRVYVSCNQCYANDLGIPPEAIVGKTDFDFFPRELAEQYRADDASVMRQGQMQEFEESFVLGGSRITVHTVKTPLFDEDGRCVGILGIFWDITARKQTEDRLRLSSVVFESIADAVAITDAAGVSRAVNMAFTQVLQYSAQEITGVELAQHIHFYPGDADKPLPAVLGGAAPEPRWHGEAVVEDRGGSRLPVWLRVNPVFDERGQLQSNVIVFSDISELKKSQSKLDFLAHHDPLTGLPNRLLLHDRTEHAIQRARRNRTMAGVLFLDLDRFKIVNDTLGHPAGDALLKQVAVELSAALRAEDTVARLGGDEFVILVEEARELSELEQVAKKVLEVVRRSYEVSGYRLLLSGSIGIATYPYDGEDVASLLKNADAALYRAKDKGRNTFQFYSAEFTEQALERIELEAELRSCLENDELVLFYQPQVDLVSGQIVGAEALLRWIHPVKGMIPPDKFIPLAEESGLIVDIGAWVLRTAARQARIWIDQQYPLRSMSVNLSGMQIQRGTIVEIVQNVLADTGLPPEALELEITESVIMNQPQLAEQVFSELRRLGVLLAVDDFGTGYSSLAYLKQFPLTSLKVDKSFLRDVPGDDNNTVITRAIIALGKTLNLNVVAEGVETDAQRQFLVAEGCTKAQGYFFSRPIGAAQLQELFEISGARDISTLNR